MCIWKNSIESLCVQWCKLIIVGWYIGFQHAYTDTQPHTPALWAKWQLCLVQVEEQLMNQTQGLTIHICCYSPASARPSNTHPVSQGGNSSQRLTWDAQAPVKT